jgi:hypothetical protein
MKSAALLNAETESPIQLRPVSPWPEAGHPQLTICNSKPGVKSLAYTYKGYYQL